MIERLLALIRDYQASVREAVLLFGRHRGIPPPTDWQGWMMRCRAGELPQRGFIDSDASLPYFLHGIGCSVGLPAGGVDWDFGIEGQFDGFDAWRLWQFARWLPKVFPEFQSKVTIDMAFAEAKDTGVISQTYREKHDQLYYVREA